MPSLARFLLTPLLALVLSTATAVSAAKQRPVGDAFPTAERLMDWINGYRHAPEPDKLPDAVHSMHRLGLFKDVESAGVVIGFIAGVLGDNPAKADDLVARMYPRPPDEQPIIIKAIAYSGLADWKALLGRFVERMPARKIMLREYIYGKGKTLYELPLEEGMAPIDTLWGYYFATGSAEPIRRIMTALAWATDKEDLDKLTAGGMAKWTLASNAVRDRTGELVEIYMVEQSSQPKEVAAQLKEVVSAAELFETQKLRKNALASIEDLRRKGPTKKGTWWNWAAGAAPTAIGLACVAASVAGQVEFGIPCVVGGALSSVGATYFGTPE